MNETPINHGLGPIPFPPPDIRNGICNCGAILMRTISIREGRCQACRNQDGAGRGK